MGTRWWLAPPALALVALLVGAAPATGLLIGLDDGASTAPSTSPPSPQPAPEGGEHPPAASPPPLQTRGIPSVYFPDPEAGIGDIQAAQMAHWERAGLVPDGLVRARELALHGDVEDLYFEWADATGDLDGDGTGDAAVHVFDFLTGQSTLAVRSGATGRELWTYDNGFLFSSSQAGLPIGEGHEMSSPMNDLNGDGTPDLVVFRYVATRVVPPFEPTLVDIAGVFAIDAAVEALNGRNGAVLWSQLLPGSRAYSNGEPLVRAWVNFPTGWLAYESPEGPRVLLKTTDYVATSVVDPACLTGITPCVGVRDVEVVEHVVLLDGAGQEVWTRDLPSTDDPEFYRLSWITGVADLTGDATPDIILEQYAERRPQFSEWPFYYPLTGDPLARYGRGMDVRALDGDDGADVWDTMVFEEPIVRANLATEEAFPVLVWIQAQVLDDLTGDGISDVLAKYLVVDSTSPGTTNGMFRTHFVPLDGTDGRPLFNARYQGWGHGATLATPGHPSPLLAIGTVDLPTSANPQGGYPPKDIHLAVLNVSAGGVPDWSTSRRFAQDNTLVFDLSLRQYMVALAPQDWDADGVRDVLTPAQYVRPSGANQTLLATSTHVYEILSGTSGKTLHRFSVWGPLGMALECDSVPGELTILSGHGRRMDATRYHPANGTVVWRQPLIFDERPRPATAGVDVLVLSAQCDDSHGVHLASVNLMTLAIGHKNDGYETPHAVAAQNRAGALLWMDPELTTDVPLVATILREPPPGVAWYLSQQVLLIPAAAVPSAGIGIALSHVVRRRNGGSP